MRSLFVALALAAVIVSAQVPGRQIAAPQNVGGIGMANIPLVFLGAQRGLAGGTGLQGLNGQLSWGWNSFGMRPYIYYWNGVSRTSIPAGPSYANPGVVEAVGELPPQLVAPDNGRTGPEWAEVQSSFASASAKVSEARAALEELRARLKAIGQSPRSNLISGTSTAEAALKAAQSRITAGNLEESNREIQRAAYLAAQVLKEFGR